MRELLLVAGTETGACALGRQLEATFEGKVRVLLSWLDPPRRGGEESPGRLRGPLRPSSPETLILLSSRLVLEELEAAGWLPPSRPLLVARRTVNPDALDQVVALPPGTKVLFVNDRAETARECVESLRDLGLDYLDWEPWYPGCPAPAPDRRIAVVPGETSLVPAGIERSIDIGVRILDFGSLAELFSLLGLPTDEFGAFSRRYLSAIVQLARRLARSTEEARRLSGHLGAVIDSLRHGILVFDEKGGVSVCNDELRSLLGIGPGQGRGSSLGSLIRSRELLDFLQARGEEESGVFKLPSGRILVRRFQVEGAKEAEGGPRADHRMATFRREEEESAEADRLAREYRRKGHVAKWSLEDIVGESEALRRAKRIAARLAATELSILISGESGTGKELFASAIHAASARASGPFLAVDLGALSDDLIESELFGYEEGAFTGAKKGGKPGLFEQADGGSLFLDEIGNISAKVQKRLLRALQEKEIMRVGGSTIRPVDVRIIAASHEDLLAKAAQGEFREDLYFRLKMGWIKIPPLRERREDIPLLARRFLSLEGCREVELGEEVLAALAERNWPGNLRELRNTLTYMLAVREGDRLGIGDLPDDEKGPDLAGHSGVRGPGPRPTSCPDPEPRLEAEDRFILLALAELAGEGRVGGRKSLAELAAKRGLLLGEGSVRSRIERLAELGLLQSSKGRAGSRLSESGRRLVEGWGHAGDNGYSG